VEGLLATAIVGAIMGLIYAPFAGGYESTILKLGFVDAEGVVASEAVKSFMSLSFYLFDIIMAVAFLALIPFVNVEKKLPEINAELLRRKKEAILAKGGTWLEPEEQDRVEREQAEREAEENRIADLAQQFSFSERNLKRRFQLATQISPNQYLQQVRVDKAKKLLLTTDMKIQQIAYEVGYENVSFFIRIFKKVTACTPTQWVK
jgi:AraC-like DNA-binding protein